MEQHRRRGRKWNCGTRSGRPRWRARRASPRGRARAGLKTKRTDSGLGKGEGPHRCAAWAIIAHNSLSRILFLDSLAPPRPLARPSARPRWRWRLARPLPHTYRSNLLLPLTKGSKDAWMQAGAGGPDKTRPAVKVTRHIREGVNKGRRGFPRANEDPAWRHPMASWYKRERRRQFTLSPLFDANSKGSAWRASERVVLFLNVLF